MTSPPIVYLDNAATTFPKPRAVIAEVNNCIRHYCGNPGRGGHPLAMASAERIFSCREAAARLIGLDRPERVVFTMNTTQAINWLLKGLLRQGDHVLLSDLEHNSVFRPIYKMAAEGIIEYDIFPSLCGSERATPTRICAGIAKRLKSNTRLVISTHMSNLCSYVLPVEQIGAFCHRHGLLFAVDAAQSAGHLPIHMADMHIDALLAPGHKGLYGIQGVGFLAFSPELTLDTVVEGGNGLWSKEPTMSEEFPERYESGTLPTPAIAGLLRGIETVERIGLEAIADHDRHLFGCTKEALSRFPNVRIYASEHAGSTLLFSIGGHSSEEVAAFLGTQGICTRGGFHCSALGHETLKTPPDGAVRISFGLYNTPSDIDRLTRAIQKV